MRNTKKFLYKGHRTPSAKGEFHDENVFLKAD